MVVKIQLAQDKDKSVIQNMDQFYIYEFSRIMPDRYALGSDGLFHDDDYDRYWQEPNCFPYLVYAEKELAGFALVQNKGTGCNLDQFFVASKFQGSGVAQQAAFQIFDAHTGPWTVQSFLGNEKSERFWKRIIGVCSNNHFEVTLQEPKKTHNEYTFCAK